MKRFFTILMLGAIVAFTSCQKDNLSDNLPDGSEVRVSLTAKVPGEMLTRAHGDADVKRYIMEVYVAGTDELYKRISQSGPVFEVRLVTGKSYDFLFWADKQADGAEPFYTTASLKAVTMVAPYIGNSEARDAFFSNELMNVQINSTPLTATLKRPFAQMNIATGLKDVPAAYQPDAVKISFETLQVYTKFDVSTGFATDNAAAAAWAASAAITGAYSVYAAGNDYKNLATDYLFASADGHSVNFTMEFYKGATPITSRAFNSIPLKRNYRTNIVGELLTVGSKITVTIDPVFAEPALSVVDVVEPATQSITDLITQAGKEAKVDPATTSTTTLVMSEPLEARHAGEPTRDIVFEDVVTGDNLKVVTLDLSKGINIPVVIKDENPATESTNYKGDIVIIVPNSYDVEGGFTFNVPNAHVVIKGTDGAIIKEIKAVTGSNTLVIEKGVTVTNLTVDGGKAQIYGTVTNLTVNKGDVEIYGTVTNAITKGGDYSDVIRVFVGEGTDRTAKTAASINTAIAIHPHVVIIGAWPTLQMKDIAKDFTLEGAVGATINAIDATDGSDWGGKINNSFVFKNLKFVGTHTFPPNSSIGTRALGFACTAITIEGCNFTNVSVASGQNAAATAVIKNNTFEMPSGVGLYLPAWVPAAGEYLIEGNTFKNCRINTDAITGRTTIKNNSFVGTSNDSFACNVLVNPARMLTVEDITSTNALFINNSSLTAVYLYFNANVGVSKLLTEQIAFADANTISVDATYPDAGNVIADNKVYVMGTNAFKSIQDALNAAAANNIIKIADGTYNENLVFPSKSLTLTGESRSGVIINGRIYSALAGTIVIESLTINAVSVDDGSATYFNTCSFKFDNCNLDFTVANNSTQKNVVVVKAASLEVTGCEITGKSYFKKGSSMDVLPMVYFSHAVAGEYAVKFTDNNIKFDCGTNTAISSSNGNAFFLSGTRAGTNQLVVTGNDFTGSSAPNNLSLPGIKRESGNTYIVGTTTVASSNNTKDGNTYNLRVENNF